MAIYHGPVPPPGTVKPINWDKIAVPIDSISGGSITSANTLGTTISLPGELLQYAMDYDIDALEYSGMKQDELELMFKKQLAEGLVAKMIADGHIVFTKQRDEASRKMRYRSYTWVGNKDFIEQQRKRK